MQAPIRSSRTHFLLLGAVALLLLTSPMASQEGGIEVFASETIFASGTRVSLSHIFRSESNLLQGSDSIPDPLDQKRLEHRLVVGVDHGLRRDLTLSALFPLVSKELESNAGDLRGEGVGDLALLAKYQAYKQDWRRGAFHVATIGGLELPTGATDVRDGGAKLAPGLQPGKGAWNPFVGLSMNLNQDRWRFDALAFFKLNTEGSQDFEEGDFLALELDGAYRFWHTKYPGPTASAKLGTRWRHQERSSQAGATLANSGFDQLLVHAGLGWHPAPEIDVSLQVEVPVYEDYGGAQLGLDYRTFLAVGLRF